MIKALCNTCAALKISVSQDCPECGVTASGYSQIDLLLSTYTFAEKDLIFLGQVYKRILDSNTKFPENLNIFLTYISRLNRNSGGLFDQQTSDCLEILETLDLEWPDFTHFGKKLTIAAFVPGTGLIAWLFLGAPYWLEFLELSGIILVLSFVFNFFGWWPSGSLAPEQRFKRYVKAQRKKKQCPYCAGTLAHWRSRECQECGSKWETPYFPADEDD